MALIQNYEIWNNNGGVGKSTITFHIASRYAEMHPQEDVIVIDMCPQANSMSLSKLRDILCKQMMRHVKINLKNSQNISREDKAGNFCFMHSLVESCGFNCKMDPPTSSFTHT